MDSQVLNYLVLVVLLLMPAALAYGVVIGTRGWLRILVLLLIFLPPPWLIYHDYDCLQHSDEIDEPCFAEAGMACVGIWFAIAALAGTVAGALRNHFRALRPVTEAHS
jgi:hypothetical protein